MGSGVDGLGWLADKRATLMATFGFSREEVMEGVSGAEGWVWYAWAKEHERSVWGQGFKRLTPGYVRQEIEAILDGKRA